MAHEKAKVYYDGNHYIAIPRTESPTTKKSVGKCHSYETEEMLLFVCSVISCVLSVEKLTKLYQKHLDDRKRICYNSLKEFVFHKDKPMKMLKSK